MTAKETLYRVPVRPWRWVPWLVISQGLVALAWWVLGWAWGLPLLLASHALFVVPVFLPNSRFYAPVLSSLPGPAVWLTIDDGPSDDTLAILDLLDRHDARATFFMVGQRAAARPAGVDGDRRDAATLVPLGGRHDQPVRRRGAAPAWPGAGRLERARLRRRALPAGHGGGAHRPRPGAGRGGTAA